MFKYTWMTTGSFSDEIKTAEILATKIVDDVTEHCDFIHDDLMVVDTCTNKYHIFSKFFEKYKVICNEKICPELFEFLEEKIKEEIDDIFSNEPVVKKVYYYKIKNELEIVFSDSTTISIISEEAIKDYYYLAPVFLVSENTNFPININDKKSSVLKLLAGIKTSDIKLIFDF